jgi:XTP/dITP diphosphohydrolase
MGQTHILVLGTRNRKKGKELLALLGPHGFELRTLADFSNAIDVVEDGDTFAANALKKASQQASQLGHWVLGEDSGLEVDSLDGRPGVWSARYSGDDATDESNNRLLLEELADVPLARRTARYVCHMTVCDPQGNPQIDCEAYCRGRIQLQPAGNAGFGYDPLFEIIEYHQTFGQLGAAVKSRISHRARAMRQVVPPLIRLARLRFGLV